MIYSMKIGSTQSTTVTGERWFASQIEGRYGHLWREPLPMEWVERVWTLEEDGISAASKHPSS